MRYKYIYNSAGEKLRSKYHVAIPNMMETFGVKPDALSQAQTLYAGSKLYHLGGNLIYKDGIIDRYLFDGGYTNATMVSPTNYHFAFYFYNRDHLGNIREVVNSAGTVCQVTNYYPSGVPYTESNSVMNAGLQPYKYNGKELDRMHGLDTYDYGARQYNPIVLRWDRMDPLCEKYYDVSPYVYCGGDSVRYIDPDGKKVYLFSTYLPGANWLGPATHTFIVVQDSKGKVTYAAYGAKYNKPMSGNDILSRCSYSKDIEAYTEYLNNHQKTDHVKDVELIPVPNGMTTDEFDSKVVEVINEFGNNQNIKYNFNPTCKDEGNCNSSTSTILLKAGVSTEKIDEIKGNMKGINWGFSSTAKPWTATEQKEAVEEENRRRNEKNRRLDALSNSL